MRAAARPEDLDSYIEFFVAEVDSELDLFHDVKLNQR